MKTKEISRMTALAIIVLLSTVGMYASTQLSENDSPQFEPTPPKKKCRKCSKFRPVHLFKKGQLEATFGLGLVPTFLADKAKVKLLPLAVGIEYRFSETFSLGATATHSISESKPVVLGDGVEATWTNRYSQFVLRPLVHITRIEDWDFYGGFSIGVARSGIVGQSNGKEEDLREYERHMGIESRTNGVFSGIAGLRYVLSPKWTVGAELGFGASIFTVGANYYLN